LPRSSPFAGVGSLRRTRTPPFLPLFFSMMPRQLC
jgi:hypothetical protein